MQANLFTALVIVKCVGMAWSVVILISLGLSLDAIWACLAVVALLFATNAASEKLGAMVQELKGEGE